MTNPPAREGRAHLVPVVLARAPLARSSAAAKVREVDADPVHLRDAIDALFRVLA
jgi:hypothetical protein